jgi:hypothetical protein
VTSFAALVFPERRVVHLEGGSREFGDGSDRVPLFSRPAAEIKDHRCTCTQRLMGDLEQSLKDVTLSAGIRLVEEWSHPLVGRQPQRSGFAAAAGASGHHDRRYRATSGANQELV